MNSPSQSQYIYNDKRVKMKNKKYIIKLFTYYCFFYNAISFVVLKNISKMKFNRFNNTYEREQIERG